MSGEAVEKIFKAFFFLAVSIFVLLNIAIFLMIIKIIFLFVPEGFTILGIKMTPAILSL
jgi:hypothetical protein